MLDDGFSQGSDEAVAIAHGYFTSSLKVVCIWDGFPVTSITSIDAPSETVVALCLCGYYCSSNGLQHNAKYKLSLMVIPH